MNYKNLPNEPTDGDIYAVWDSCREDDEWAHANEHRKWLMFARAILSLRVATLPTSDKGFPGAVEWLDEDHPWLRLSETLAADKMLSLINPSVTLGKYREALNGLVLEISRQERERAARICEGANNHDNPMTANDCADEIRKFPEA